MVNTGPMKYTWCLWPNDEPLYFFPTATRFQKASCSRKVLGRRCDDLPYCVPSIGIKGTDRGWARSDKVGERLVSARWGEGPSHWWLHNISKAWWKMRAGRNGLSPPQLISQCSGLTIIQRRDECFQSNNAPLFAEHVQLLTPLLSHHYSLSWWSLPSAAVALGVSSEPTSSSPPFSYSGLVLGQARVFNSMHVYYFIYSAYINVYMYTDLYSRHVSMDAYCMCVYMYVYMHIAYTQEWMLLYRWICNYVFYIYVNINLYL